MCSLGEFFFKYFFLHNVYNCLYSNLFLNIKYKRLNYALLKLIQADSTQEILNTIAVNLWKNVMPNNNLLSCKLYLGRQCFQQLNCLTVFSTSLNIYSVLHHFLISSNCFLENIYNL